MPAEGPGAFVRSRIGVWLYGPNRVHHDPMDLANLGESEDFIMASPITCYALAVHPVGCVGVTLNFHVLPELLVSDGAAFG